MLKRALAALGVLVVLGVIYTLVTGTEEPPETKPTLREKDPPPVWNGSATRLYDTTLTQRGDSLAIESVDFTGLVYSRANLTVNLRVTSNEGSPKWLRRSNFKGFISPNSNLNTQGSFIEPSGWITQTAAASQLVKVSFRGIPTVNLGPTCLMEEQANGPISQIPNVPFMLVVDGLPGGRNSFATVAPPAPEGKCIADPKAIAQQKLLERMRNGGIRVAKTSAQGSAVTMRGVTTVQGLKKLTFQARKIGTPRPWRTVHSVGAKPRWSARFKLPAKGKWQVRVGGSGPPIGPGVIYPNTALRVIAVK